MKEASEGKAASGVRHNSCSPRSAHSMMIHARQMSSTGYGVHGYDSCSLILRTALVLVVSLSDLLTMVTVSP